MRRHSTVYIFAVCDHRRRPVRDAARLRQLGRPHFFIHTRRESGRAATTTNTYDTDGNQASTTSPLGNLSGANAANYTTTNTYDADGEPTETVLAGGTGATSASVTNATYYDPDGNVVAITAPAVIPTARVIRRAVIR